MSKQSIKKIIFSSTGKLAATYLVIIMAMSIGFSVVFYNTSSQQFNRPFPPSRGFFPTAFENPANQDEIRLFIEQRFQKTREALYLRLLWLNLLALGLGGIFSYALARWTLRPIEESVEVQNQFVADASHELRTPLTTLQTTNEVALRKKKLSKTETNKLLAQNIEEIEGLKELTNSLLDLLKNDGTKISLADVNIQDIVAESLGNVVKLAQSKDIVIEDKTPQLNIKTEPSLLTRIISILLDNAIKYSDSGKKVTITATNTREFMEIQIQDRGIGIKASELPHIFRRFYRADKSRTSQDSGGYGLGLAIAEKIASRIGGGISATSKVGRGSTFTVRLKTNS